MDDSPWDDDAIDHDISRSNTEWNNLSESFTNVRVFAILAELFTVQMIIHLRLDIVKA